MTLDEEFHRVIRAWDEDRLTLGELLNEMMAQLGRLPSPEAYAAVEELSAHPDADIREAALECRGLMRHAELSKDIEYIRKNSPLEPGARLELFGGYDYYSSEGKPWWLGGKECYRATFIGFASYGEGTIPAALVEFDDIVDVPGHKGRFGILRTSYGPRSFAWEEPEDVVEVHVTETLPEDLASIRHRLTADFAAETHATYRLAGISA